MEQPFWKAIIDADLVAKVAEIYVEAAGFGHHFAADGKAYKIGNYFVFRLDHEFQDQLAEPPE